MASFKENLVLSKISYIDFNKNEMKLSIGSLLKKPNSSLNQFLKKNENTVWHQDLESMKDWKIINFQPN